MDDSFRLGSPISQPQKQKVAEVKRAVAARIEVGLYRKLRWRVAPLQNSRVKQQHQPLIERYDSWLAGG